ncbi:MAG: HAMP domain-containing histidine kinase [Bdellovibrionaceae bacterium]|nr:HAMP domain-containing histidine kinase [Pseudobdellovibrionaceae bacterium]
MITINAWFRKNAMRPLVLLGLIVFGVQIVFIYHYISSNEASRVQGVSSLVHQIANTAIEQKNRDIIESTFQVAVQDLGAKYVLLCKDNRVRISYPYTQGDCKSSISPSWSERKILIEVPGYTGYKYIFVLPRWQLSSTFLIITLLTLGSTLVCFFIIFRVQRKLKADILNPLAKQFFTQNTMEIVELENLRATVQKIHQNERDAAVLKATKESEAKFIHNIQSPLGNIKILEERLKAQLDPESAKLLKSVVSDISEVTLNYTKRASTQNEVDKATSDQKAYVDIFSVIEDSVSTKSLELTNRANAPALIFKWDRNTEVFVEASLVELRSILSNVLNNAVDSGASLVNIDFEVSSGIVRIGVRDNGSGVNPSVQRTLFEQNVTFGKENGTGFGLFHARSFLNLWGGSIELAETSSSGSLFIIQLPILKLPEIKIAPHSKIVILEDKLHERNRLRKKLLSSSAKPDQIIEFNKTSRALEWFEKTDVPMSDIILFADNDLGDAEMSGFDMIRSLGIEGMSYLVTNSQGSEELVTSCRQIGLPLVPKSCVSNMKIITASCP